MTLRRQLMVVYLLLAALPVVAWQSGRQVESFLRESRAEAHLASANAMAASLDLAQLPGFTDQDLYVNLLDGPVQADGYDGDWKIWSDFQQLFEGRQDRFSLSLQLARWEREIFLLIRVRDTTPQRASELAGNYQPGDHLQISLRDQRGFTRYRLVPTVPGAMTLLPMSDASANQTSAQALPPPVSGGWREVGEGYQVELRLNRALLGDGLDLRAVDTRQGLGEPQVVMTATSAGSARLIDVDGSLSRQLASLTPAGNQAWLLHPKGWVVAHAGTLGGASEEVSGGWQQLAYRMLAGNSLQRAASRNPGLDLKLTGPEVLAARQGQQKVSWRRVSQGRVESSVALPLANSGAVLVLEQPADPLLLATNRSALRMLGLTLLVVFVVVAGLLAHSTWLSLRIRRLRDAAEQALSRFSEGEDASLPGTGSLDEIGDLARSFSGLFDELRSYNHYLKTLASKLSHELNTPLAVVRSSLDNLRHENLPAQALAFAQRADDGASRLRNILQAMSEASRLEHSLEQAEALGFDLAEVVSGCVAGYRNAYPDCQWVLNTPAAAPMVGAPELLAQMLDKLADNAAGFCPAGGTVSVELSGLRRGWRLVFSNDGPALPDHLREQIFESLVSARNGEAGQVHLGLGLHIVRLIVRAHAGRISARNRRDGSGVEFVLNLVSRTVANTSSNSPGRVTMPPP